MKDCNLLERDATALVEDEAASKMFDETISAGCDAKMAFSWIMAELLGRLHKTNTSISESSVDSTKLIDLLTQIKNGTISGKMAKDVLDEMLETGKAASQVIKEKGLQQIDDSDAIEAIIKEIIAANPDKVIEYRSGKDKLFGFFVGQAMKATNGKANPQKISDILHNYLKN